jgi:hypothetical protein
VSRARHFQIVYIIISSSSIRLAPSLVPAILSPFSTPLRRLALQANDTVHIPLSSIETIPGVRYRSTFLLPISCSPFRAACPESTSPPHTPLLSTSLGPTHPSDSPRLALAYHPPFEAHPTSKSVSTPLPHSPHTRLKRPILLGKELLIGTITSLPDPLFRHFFLSSMCSRSARI